ncbi:MAG TPA: hypothetical protein DIC64_04910 [Alphaproteobacteria bacterium]|nr:hypothetical protein [Alphaproteobacteria bacterium]
MYYKLLNKTLLTSALVSLICVSVNQASAQELFGADDEANLALPLPEDDIIPLAADSVIEPASDVAPTPEAPVVESKPENVVTDMPEVNFDDNFDISLEEPKDMPAPIFAEEEHILPPAPDVSMPAKEEEPKVVKPQAPRAPQRNAPKPQRANLTPGQQAPIVQQAPSEPLKFGDSVLAQTNNELFNQMSDIEKQTTLLTLELKREKIKNEVEAAKAVRERAEQEKIAMEEAKARQEAEWQKEQEVKVIKAQEELKQKEIELEKLKQRKALTAYMNSMLEQKQSWIEENSKLYDEINSLKETNTEIRQAYKKDLDNLSKETDSVLKNAETAKSNHERTVASLTAQNAQLKKRIEADELAAKNGKANPFAAKEGSNNVSTPADALIKPINIAKEYAIMEITGKGGDLYVKLINKAGDSFTAKTGTVLQTGHMVEEITPTYVQFDRNGLKDFLYTSTTALSTEPNNVLGQEDSPSEDGASARPKLNLISDEDLPSLGDSMFVK